MNLPFVKYHGTGNDFVLIDNRSGIWENFIENAPESSEKNSCQKLVSFICNRHIGIGADGLILLQNIDGYDFEMIYFNSDGKTSSMCGNGGRCIAHWSFSLGLGDGKLLNFWAADGAHQASKKDYIGTQKTSPKVNTQTEFIQLTMNAVDDCKLIDSDCFEIHTGSPHYVQFSKKEINTIDLISWAKSIRYNEAYKEKGINVNIVHILGNRSIQMRTYERGVENETMSCGTGVVAAALSFSILNDLHGGDIDVITCGGELRVRFSRRDNGNKSSFSSEKNKPDILLGIIPIPDNDAKPAKSKPVIGNPTSKKNILHSDKGNGPESNPAIGFHQIFLEGPAQKVFEGSIPY